MSKKVLLSATPTPAANRLFSESIRALYPVDIDDTKDGLLIGVAPVVSLDPTTGEHQRHPALWWISGLIVAAGDTVLAAAAPGRRHRVLGMIITLASGTTAAAASLLTIADAAAPFVIIAIAGAALAASPVGIQWSVNFPGNGFLCALPNTVINVNLTTALAVGGVCVTMWGVDEPA
jgi:hypothetical protein